MSVFAMIAIVLILFISSITIEKYLKENNRQNVEIIRLLKELNSKQITDRSFDQNVQK